MNISLHIPIDLWRIVSSQISRCNKDILLKSINKDLHKNISIYKFGVEPLGFFYSNLDKYPNAKKIELLPWSPAKHYRRYSKRSSKNYYEPIYEQPIGMVKTHPIMTSIKILELHDLEGMIGRWWIFPDLVKLVIQPTCRKFERVPFAIITIVPILPVILRNFRFTIWG